ncbi:MAG: CsgG/HfaB family protein [Spirochaetaceae bacterium]|jgi:TolB-like protein|nr:CsgG/HfaB family protein [Spirochaetaceae bacterium]
MYKCASFLWGIGLVFSLLACKTGDRADHARESASVFVRRIDNKGDKKVRIYLDGKRAGSLANGEIGSYTVSEGMHSIYANYDGDEHRRSEILYFTMDNRVYHFSVEVLFHKRGRYAGITLLQEDAAARTPQAARNGGLDALITASFNAVSKSIPEKSIVAVVHIASQDEKARAYILEELTLLLVNAGKYDVVDRASLDVIKREQHFQMTGEVDDNSILSIGHLLGAEIVITGSLDEEGTRLRVKALDVLTARIVAMSSEKI